jgi:hypothetical protein
VGAIDSTDAWLQRIRSFSFSQSAAAPRLLYGPGDVARLRQRARQFPAWLDQLRQAGEKAAAYPVEQLAQTTEAYYELPYLEAVSNAYLYWGEPRLAQAAEQIIEHFLQAEPWVAHVHWPMRFDHCAANTASAIVQALDAIAGVLPSARREEICRRLVTKAILPFTQVCRERDPFWSRRETKSNWRIMTCGEAGLAVLGTAEYNPDLPESLAFAAEGVLDTLAYVPPEGDWPEGLVYWLTTLGFGLRFMHALYRMTGGQINLFEHPALGVTGDYLIHLLKPDGSVYNFNDNRATIGGDLFGYLRLLAHYRQRPDWAWVAARSPEPSLFSLLLADADENLKPPTARAAYFPSTGVVAMRSGWQPRFTFVGFKSGPSNVGHSHLDANAIFLAVDGQDLIREEGYWSQDHPGGFFEAAERRWHYDANATVGHNTLLVDGHGQTWGPAEYAGKIERFEEHGTHFWTIGEASAAYPGLLHRFRRWLVFVPPALLVVFDEVESDRPRHFEWLIHYGGRISGERDLHIIRSGHAAAVLRWLAPDARRRWRVSDVTRTTYYEDADYRRDVAMQVAYRSFGPIHRAQALDALLVITTGEPEEWTVADAQLGPEQVSLRAAGPQGAAWQVTLDRRQPNVAVRRVSM